MKKTTKEKKEISIILNGIEGHPLKVDSVLKIPGSIVYMLSSRVKFMSLDALKVMMHNIADIVEEASVLFKMGGVSVTRYAKSIRKKADLAKDTETLFSYLYDQLLASEHLNTLPGFGYVTFEKNEEGGLKIKGRYMINPEKSGVNFL